MLSPTTTYQGYIASFRFTDPVFDSQLIEAVESARVVHLDRRCAESVTVFTSEGTTSDEILEVCARLSADLVQCSDELLLARNRILVYMTELEGRVLGGEQPYYNEDAWRSVASDMCYLTARVQMNVDYVSTSGVLMAQINYAISIYKSNLDLLLKLKTLYNEDSIPVARSMADPALPATWQEVSTRIASGRARDARYKARDAQRKARDAISSGLGWVDIIHDS